MMEAKLAEYRARKLRETQLSKIQTEPLLTNESHRSSVKMSDISKKQVEAFNEPCSSQPEYQLDSLPNESTALCRKLDIAMVAVKFAIWGLLQTLFVHLGFGAVFFVLSVFYLMFTNFRKTPKKPGEVSAYSVFNPNCENIEGALTAAQFERELMFRQT